MKHYTRKRERGGWKERWYNISCLYKQTDLQTEEFSQWLVKNVLTSWNIKFHPRVNKIPPLDPNLRRILFTHSHSIYFRSLLISYSHTHLHSIYFRSLLISYSLTHLQRSRFFDLYSIHMYMYFTSRLPMCATCPTHLILLDLLILAALGM
jgi:hypothetical protein